MGIYEKLLEIEEQCSKECMITVRLRGDLASAEIYADNCRKVISCDDEFITLGVNGASVRISGTPLRLESFGVGGVKIAGKLCSIDFEESDENG